MRSRILQSKDHSTFYIYDCRDKKISIILLFHIIRWESMPFYEIWLKDIQLVRIVLSQRKRYSRKVLVPKTLHNEVFWSWNNLWKKDSPRIHLALIFYSRIPYNILFRLKYMPIKVFYKFSPKKDFIEMIWNISNKLFF